METHSRLQAILHPMYVVDVEPTGRWKVMTTDDVTTLWVEVTRKYTTRVKLWEKPHFWSRQRLVTLRETKRHTEFISEHCLLLTVTHTYPINECGSN